MFVQRLARSDCRRSRYAGSGVSTGSAPGAGSRGDQDAVFQVCSAGQPCQETWQDQALPPGGIGRSGSRPPAETSPGSKRALLLPWALQPSQGLQHILKISFQQALYLAVKQFSYHQNSWPSRPGNWDHLSGRATATSSTACTKTARESRGR